MCCGVVVWLCLGAAVTAGAEQWQHPVIQAVKAAKPPVIDGVLDDPCWKSASMVEGFRYFPKHRPATENTQVWMCYDSQACYFAFYCYDTHPEQLRANERKRNGENFWSDDWVQIRMDPTHCHLGGQLGGWYKFYLNPIGAQYERRAESEVEKIQWRGDWRGGARMVADGWTAEFAIPFAILKYGKGQSVFGLDLVRYIAREDEETSWAPMPDDAWDAVYTADWVDLQTPHVKRKPVVMGYATAEAAEEGSGLRAGLDVKQIYEPDVTVVASVNPDFENVEDEVESIIFSYAEKYVPDRRTFFMEGERYFPGSHIFYSRRVPQFDLGMKAHAKLGQWQFAMLDALQVGDRNDLAACARYRTSPYEYYEAGYAAADWTGTHNRVGGLSYFYDRAVAQGDVTGSAIVARSSSAGAGGDGMYQDYGCDFSPNPGYLGGSIGYTSIPADYNAVDGYVGEQGYRGVWGGLTYSDTHQGGRLQWWGCSLDASRYQAEGGRLHHSGIGGQASVRTREGRGLNLGYSRSERPPNINRTWQMGVGWNQNVPLESGQLVVLAGKMLGGDYLYTSLYQHLCPREDWSLRVSGAYQRMALPNLPVDDVFQGILSANYDIDPEHTLAGRYVNTGGTHNFYVSYRQVVRRGMDAYVIIGNPNAERTESRLAVKLVSMF